jgi:hypothetical protein
MGTIKVTKTGETYTLEDADGKVFVGLSPEEAVAGINSDDVGVEELEEAIAAGQGGVAHFDEEDTEVEDEDEEDEEEK